ncbi:MULTISPECIES: hypothetical protein [unclassified Pantoea]|uniref:hypothetical protein n=1 Tax=unclassified Pantoea TaxID=2630326 RepID=UPI002477BD8C|nr:MULTISPECIES: hypothetical protein [unclassified Pantoea]GME48229.1 hypothetical protein ACJ3_45000 [Pantoea sp. QMID3]GME48351.1 hypothetical protein ACJ1_44720 [Pantoea sp. QMID1]GME63003.1 hypothetical protein ACJ4_44880 [Pantoea sp. QMID4]GME64078.1 hypothetical protein ACJ2_45000 [Pantoea sp. QMID2]
MMKVMKVIKMKAERRSAAAVLAALMLTALAGHAGAAPPATCSLKLRDPASRSDAQASHSGPELLTATCGAGAAATLTETCGADGAVQRRITLTGGQHRYRLPGCPAGAGKETLSVTYN